MGTGCPFHHVAARWQESIDQQKEFTVIRDGNICGTSFTDSFLFRSEYEHAQALRESLLGKYEGCELEEILPGKEFETPFGTCFEISSNESFHLDPGDPKAVHDTLCMDLKLLHGIGRRTEEYLKKRGYRTMYDLLHHPRYRHQVIAALRLLQEEDPAKIVRWITRWYPASHPLALHASRLHKPEEFIYFDIETLGLFSRPIILFGIGRFSGGRIAISQYLLRDIAEEQAAIKAVTDILSEEHAALVTFNGRSFDVPYLRERSTYYGQPFRKEPAHFDLLHFARRRWKTELPDCRLQTLERYLFGIRREEDVPSAMVPEFYTSFQKTGNPGPLIPIVTHNRQDIITLARIHQRLMEEWHDCS